MVRLPRVQDCVSSGRLVKGTKDSAGKHSGTSGAQLGHASRTWACSEAAGWFLRNHPAGQKDGARLEKTPGTGNALTIVAHQFARAVYSMVRRETACELHKVLTGERSGVREP
jgi:hypothetical protein